ncbi:MAG: peptide chain release factor 1 [Spartobacteria bacterium]|nr:peptide chain release factor 1 [Spartobacteria bacterium]
MISASYLDKVNARLAAVEARLSAPDTAADHNRFRSLMSEHNHLKKLQGVAQRYFTLLKDMEDSRALLENDGTETELREMAEEELALCEQHLPAAEKALMIALLPPRPEDSRNTIFEIRAGTGGDEAALFAADLFRMYARFAEEKGWRTNVIDANASNIGGYKEIIFSVEGQDVYRTLRYESGVHRVQRIPVTEAGGRIHTSAATVAVLPEAEEIDVVIKPEEVRVDIFRSSGPGGQSVNTTDSAVRLTHLATGLVVQCQDEKSQHRNKEKAMRVLRARLLDRLQDAEDEKRGDARRSQVGSGDRSERVRTYNFPQNRVTDHRINMTLYNLDRFMEGDIDDLLNALYEHDVQERLQKEVDVDVL